MIEIIKMHFNIILCFWTHLDSCSLLWTHFRGAAICAGRLFQILMVSEKKDLWYIKVLANGILYLYMCPLTDVACGVKWVVGMSTKPCTIRYIITTLYWALRSCSGAQFSSFSIGVTLVVCLKSLYTNRADRHCTASSLFMFSLV